MDSLIKLGAIILFIIFIFGMMALSAYNAIQVGLLKTELVAVNKAWSNSNQYTSEALSDSDDIKYAYSHNFYKALTLIKAPNDESKCLNESLSNNMRDLLKLPPKDLNKIIHKKLRYEEINYN